MTKEQKVEVDFHDEDNDIVEETLEERAEPKGAGAGKDDSVQEPESIASVDKAADATSKAPVPKTKAGMINAMYQKMNAMKKHDLQAAYGKMMGEDVDFDEDLLSEEEIDTASELDSLIESEATLSDEFKSKTAILFEAAVKSKLSEEVSRLEEQYQEELSEAIAEVKSDLVEKVDSYLNYVVETWMEENRVAIQNGLRTEIAETFMNKMKDLFVESYIDVPESKVDLVDELATQVEELEEKLNTQTGEAIKLTEELEVYKRNAVIAEACRDLAETQIEKLKSLVENVDFEDEDSFATKIATIKESYFSKKATETNEFVEEEAEEEIEVSSVMERYLKTIRQTSQKQ